MIALLYLIMVFVGFAFCFTIGSIIDMIFQGNYVFIQSFIKVVIYFLFGYKFGIYMGRKLLYIKLKKLYKNQKEKGETK